MAGVPECPQGHVLESKVVAGSWIWGAKACGGCSATLKAGETRFSCKPCSYHLCGACHSAVATARQAEDITITVFRAASFEGGEDDAWQVQVERGATVGSLMDNISVLYGVPRQCMVLRSDAGAEPLVDTSPHGCVDGDVLHLDVLALGFQAPWIGAPMGNPMEGAAGMAEALAGLAQQALEAELAGVELTLTLVLRPAAGEERRCQLTVEALACVQEVMEMAHLELDVPVEERHHLEFAGERLPPEAPLHAVQGLGDGDTVLVLPGDGVDRTEDCADGTRTGSSTADVAPAPTMAL